MITLPPGRYLHLATGHVFELHEHTTITGTDGFILTV